MCIHLESISPVAIKMSVLIPWGRKCYHFHFYLFLSLCHLVYILCIFLKVIIYYNSNAYIIFLHNIIRSLTVCWKMKIIWILDFQESENCQNLLHKMLLNLGEFTNHFLWSQFNWKEAECSEHPCLHEFA